MLQNNPQLSTEFRPGLAPQPGLTFSAPGKIFLLGEYAVLAEGAGLPAVVAAIGPRFTVVAERAMGPESSGFHPKSPAGRLLDWASSMRADELSLRFEDPFEGAGGFGASTAQFALAYRTVSEVERWDRSWERVWRLYRELTSGSSGAVAPSGADLVAQWRGGIVLFTPGTPEGPRCEELLFDAESILVFSAAAQPGRKVATHEHLAALSSGERLSALAESLRPSLEAGISAMRRGDLKSLGNAFTEYGNALAAAGLEIPATAEDRVALAAVPGVLGTKGAGALQADAVLVVVDPMNPQARQAVIDLATRRGLELVCDGIEREPGVS